MAIAASPPAGTDRPRADRVRATPAALAAIARLRAEHEDVLFYLSGGCCDGSLPMCFADGDLVVGDLDVELGSVGGCPLFLDPRQLAVWQDTQVTLDVADGEPEGFSLPAGPGQHFVAHSRVCPSDELTPLVRGPRPRPAA